MKVIDRAETVLAVAWWLTALTFSAATAGKYGPVTGLVVWLLILMAYKHGHDTGKFKQRIAAMEREQEAFLRRNPEMSVHVGWTCPCGKTTYNPNDVKEQYCPNCHAFHPRAASDA